MNYENFLRHSLQLAMKSRENGNHPFGALLVQHDQILATSENEVITSNDVTQHAELRLVSEASRRFRKEQLAQSTLYTSTEPCAMCAGAIYWSGIRKVVFGLPARELGDLTTGSFVVESKEVFRYGREATQIVGPLLLEESRLVHRDFW